MKSYTKLLLGTALLIISAAQLGAAARIEPEPGKGPAMLIEVLEKDKNITMTFRTTKEYQLTELGSASVWHSKPSKEIKAEVSKGLIWEITFTIPKDKLDSTTLYLNYYYDLEATKDPKKKDKKETGNLLSVNISVAKYYEHYIKSRK